MKKPLQSSNKSIVIKKTPSKSVSNKTITGKKTPVRPTAKKAAAKRAVALIANSEKNIIRNDEFHKKNKLQVVKNDPIDIDKKLLQELNFTYDNSPDLFEYLIKQVYQNTHFFKMLLNELIQDIKNNENEKIDFIFFVLRKITKKEIINNFIINLIDLLKISNRKIFSNIQKKLLIKKIKENIDYMYMDNKKIINLNIETISNDLEE